MAFLCNGLMKLFVANAALNGIESKINLGVTFLLTIVTAVYEGLIAAREV